MLSFSRRSTMASLVMFALLLTMLLPSLAAARTQQDPADKNKKEKPAKDEKNTLSKRERKWLEVYRFSKQFYETNPDFRLEVDEAYRRIQREHSEYAFSVNAEDAKGELVKKDKYKLPGLSLYNNPLAQDYVNRVGQSMVPAGSDKLYAFRIMLNPIPEARSLSTGTIYVSTGLLASIDNEAQLAYVLGHEIVHVEKEHWKEDVLVAQGLEEWNEKNRQQREKISLVAKIGLGIATRGLVDAGNYTGAGATFFADAAVPTIFKLLMPDAVVGWDRQQEDQADETALRYMLDRKYDPREVSKFFAKLKSLSQRDKRAGLGFIASAARLAEREPMLTMAIPLLVTSGTSMLSAGASALNAHNMQQQASETLKAMLPKPEKPPDSGKKLDPTANAAGREEASQAAVTGEYAARVQELLDAGELIGSSAEFQSVMAAIRRDNGIRAFYYDMFYMARENLEESLRIRSNDPFAHYYYGVVLKLTARTLGEKQRALNEFALAVQYDRRKVLAEPYLHRALAMIDSRESHTREIVENLKEYVQLYQRQNAGALPASMDLIYDYMQDAGETSWTAIPAMNVSTKNIDPVVVTSPVQRTAAAPASEPVPVPSPVTQSQTKKPATRRQ
jgi:predicted Zn-dependent protease